MIRVSSRVLLHAAGARWAPAALLATVVLATSAATAAPQEPAHRDPPAEPAGSRAAPSATPERGTAAPGGRPPVGTPTTGVLTLSQLASESTLVADGVVEGTQSLDDDRLRVYRVRILRTIQGASAAEAAVVEMRGATSRPGLLADGVRAVLLLRPSPRLSYLAEHLPDGTHHVLSGGRDGIIPIANDGEARTVETTLAEAIRVSRLTDATEADTARRALAFAELETGHGRLAADALVQLRRLDDVAALGADEVHALGQVLAAGTVPATTRIGLIQLVGERRWTAALPALRGAVIDPPDVLDAVMAARARLGVAADKTELRPYLSSKDPAVRAAAVRALAALPEPALGELGHFATADADLGVRVVAIDALGTSKRPDAVPTLSRTFEEPSRDVRQASGRALLAIGGQAASDAFVNLALHGGDADTRKYAAVLLLVSTGRDSPAVQRLMASNPGGEVREVVEHGLQWQHSHQHEGE